MNRRNAIQALLAALASSSGVLPLPAYGQARVRRIVSVTGNAERTVAEPFKGFLQELKILGYQEERDFTLSIGYGEFSRERTARLAAEAIATKPDLIFAQHGAVHAFAALTRTIPIVIIYSGDLVEAGLAKSLARPGGNITGMQLLHFDLVGKRIEVLKELAPRIKRLAVLAMPNHAGIQRERDLSVAAAQQLGLSVAYYPVNNPQEVDAALVAARSAGVHGLVIFPDPITMEGRERIAAFALKHKMPVVGGWDNYPLAGALASYGPNLGEAWRRTASHVDRILKGADPASLPVELPTIVELVVNLKTARALGLKVPQSLLLRADRVID
ncbi:MAG: hypothetical protein EXR27_13065 [Betaproteobacteria bacterium]|nr:hypothetical protein [Betaproteobacteria bacterium]